MQPFSTLDASTKNFLTERINQRWGQLHALEKDWGEKALKYLMLTNSGGAIATLGFLGAFPEAIGLIGAKIALTLFVFGVIVVGIGIAKTYHHMSNLYKRWRSEVENYYTGKITWEHLHAEDEKRSVTDFWDYLLPYSSFGFFIGGCIAGAWSLLTRTAS